MFASQRKILLLTLVCAALSTPTSSIAQNTKFDQEGIDTKLYAHQKVGRPYKIMGKLYTPKHNPSYDEIGIASWYGPNFHGKLTANGETFDQNGMTAAHETLPLNSMVVVTNVETGKSITVRLNDRGPFVDGRIIDLSQAAAKALGVSDLGEVRVQYAGPADPMAEQNQAVSEKERGEPNSTLLQPEDGGELTLKISGPIHLNNSDRGEDLTLSTNQSAKVNSITHYVYAVTFSSRQRAENVRARLSKAGVVLIQETQLNGTTLYNVMVGPFNSKQTANQAQQVIASFGFTDAKVIVVD